MGKIDTAALDRTAVKQAESRRLIATLHYYAWLEEQGLSWDKIAGIQRQPVDTNARVRGQYWRHCRQHDVPIRPKTYLFISYKLKDGTIVVVPWPPYANNVIFNEPITEANFTADAVRQLPKQRARLPFMR